jgi:hypothetical protein
MPVPIGCSPDDAKKKVPSQAKLDPIDSSLFSVKKDDDGALPVSLQDDFGEFLLDAVQWL